jgi:hypothetical protein
MRNNLFDRSTTACFAVLFAAAILPAALPASAAEDSAPVNRLLSELKTQSLGLK